MNRSFCFLPMTVSTNDSCVPSFEPWFKPGVNGRDGVDGSPGVQGLSDEELAKVLARMKILLRKGLDDEEQKRAKMQRRFCLFFVFLCFAYGLFLGLHMGRKCA